MGKKKDISNKLIALRTRREGLWNDNRPWSQEELFLLKQMFFEGKGLSAIAIELGRTELSVMQKALQLDLVAEETRPRRPNCPKDCQCDKCSDALSCMYYRQKLEDEAAAEQEDSGKNMKPRNEGNVRRCSFRPEANS